VVKAKGLHAPIGRRERDHRVARAKIDADRDGARIARHVGLGSEERGNPVAVAVAADKMGASTSGRERLQPLPDPEDRPALSERLTAAIEMPETVKEPEQQSVVAEGRSSLPAR
jgi:hypothetical protein